MFAVEQTANMGGGATWSLADIEALGALAEQQVLAYHMDGARLLNAVVASGVSAKDFARPFDSLWIELSKGLGCPVGPVLAGSRAFIAQACRRKHRNGGAMPQAGTIPAAADAAPHHNLMRTHAHQAHPPPSA